MIEMIKIIKCLFVNDILFYSHTSKIYVVKRTGFYFRLYKISGSDFGDLLPIFDLL